MRSRNITMGLLVLLIVGFGYFILNGNQRDVLPKEITQNDTKNKVNYFAQNQTCLKYKTNLENKLAQKKPYASSLEQIFYSPKQNSCLYVRYEDLANDTENLTRYYIRSLYDVLDDGPSSTPLEQCIATEKLGENKCAVFDEKLIEYKQQ